MRFSILGLLSIFLLGSNFIVSAASYVNPLKHDIVLLTSQNFDTLGKSNNDGKVSAVLFYQGESGKQIIDVWYNNAARDLKGIVRVGAIDCIVHKRICESALHRVNGIDTISYPIIVIYPPNPIHPMIYSQSYDKDSFSRTVTRFISAPQIQEVTDETFDGFLRTSIALPKVVLFTQKDSIHYIFAAIANEFKDEMNFAVAKISNSKAFAKKATVSSAAAKGESTIVLFKNEKPHVYKDNLRSFQSIYNFLNPFKEIFVQGGGFSHKASGGAANKDNKETQPWKYEEIPELTSLSNLPVCFKQDRLCVIFVSDGRIDDATRTMLTHAKAAHSRPSAGRLGDYKWSWLDVSTQPKWREALGENYPFLMIFNPKKNRYTRGEGITTGRKEVNDIINGLESGNAQFKILRKLPEFVAAPNSSTLKDEL